MSRQRVSGVCVYHGTKLYKFVVSSTTYVSKPSIVIYDNRDGEDFDTFNELYSRLLKLLKDNHFYAKSSVSYYGRVFYDIYFVDYENPALINQFGHRE